MTQLLTNEEEREMKLDQYKDFAAWIIEHLDREDLKGLATYGAVSGFPYLTYYSDTVRLYEHFKEEIWEMLLNDTEEFGFKNPYELLASFSGAKDVGGYIQHANLLTWYAAERYASSMF